MNTFALIANGTVAQISAVEFSVHPDFVWVDISTVSPAPQTGWSATQAGGVWSFSAPPAPSALTLAQQAEALLGMGLSITSTGTLALSAVIFPTDSDTQQWINSEMIALLNSGFVTFADGEATIDWPDSTGTGHPMTPAQFRAIAGAIGAFVSSCIKVRKGQLAALPAASVSITTA
ncbi:MAG: hypothetical protein P4L83_02465 [Nevskia sp.]|nr:hypothetical protein [Nevskia sp.]